MHNLKKQTTAKQLVSDAATDAIGAALHQVVDDTTQSLGLLTMTISLTQSR